VTFYCSRKCDLCQQAEATLFSTQQWQAGLERGWQSALGAEFEKPYMQELVRFLNEQQHAKTIYPPAADMLAAFNQTPFDRVKVVIIGQDPYHGSGQAHGLSFSVPAGVSPPPSLMNILKELDSDIRPEQRLRRDRGCLSSWARQGVLLLNAVLSVEAGLAGAHQGRGWELFTDAVVARLCAQHKGIVFMLWGKYAQQKCAMVDTCDQHILIAPHPSPLSAHRGFLGCRHFSKANDYLALLGRTPIDWCSIE